MATPLHVELQQTRPWDLLEEEAHVSIGRTAALLERAFAQLLKPHGITPTQYNVLRILRGAGDQHPGFGDCFRLLLNACFGTASKRSTQYG